MQVYLDNSATTRPYDAVVERMSVSMKERYANPSSLYRAGMESEREVAAARGEVARLLARPPEQVIFTSGGTESDNMAIRGAFRAARRRGMHCITTKVEHPAVLEAFRRLEEEGAEVTYIGVDEECRLNPEELKDAVRQDTVLISVMSVNNEIGTRMPIGEIARIKGDALLHTDAVQALGKEDLKKCPADLISVSSHKIHGPRGVGALIVGKGVHIPPFIVGGGQEGGMRSGTENQPAIAGFGLAASLADEHFAENLRRLETLNALLRRGITEEIKECRIHTPQDACPSVLNVSFLGTRAEVILHALEAEGIFVATRSACSSGKKDRSHVLRAMGLSEKETESAIRFSFGFFNTEKEIVYTVDKLKTVVARFRRLGAFR